MSEHINQPQVLEYENGESRQHRQPSPIARCADCVAMFMAALVGCTFVGSTLRMLSNHLAISAYVLGAFGYCIARIVSDRGNRTTSIHMFLAGLPALWFGLMIFVGVFYEARRFGFRGLQHAWNDAEPLTLACFLFAFGWFCMARVYAKVSRS